MWTSGGALFRANSGLSEGSQKYSLDESSTRPAQASSAQASSSRRSLGPRTSERREGSMREVTLTLPAEGSREEVLGAALTQLLAQLGVEGEAGAGPAAAAAAGQMPGEVSRQPSLKRVGSKGSNRAESSSHKHISVDACFDCRAKQKMLENPELVMARGRTPSSHRTRRN